MPFPRSNMIQITHRSQSIAAGIVLRAPCDQRHPSGEKREGMAAGYPLYSSSRSDCRPLTILKVRHVTSYSYKRPVAFGEHRILSRPRDSNDQRLLLYDLRIWPAPTDLHWIHDAFNNCVAVANFDAKAAALRFESTMVLDHTPQEGPRFRTALGAKRWPLEYEREVVPDLEACMRRQYADDGEVERWALQFVKPHRRNDIGRILASMTRAVHKGFAYSRRSEPGTRPPLKTLASMSGSCRDFALLMMEAARSLGLAARFVTGYIYVPARDGPTLHGGGATHAWVQIFLPGAGWVEFDPTNGIIGNRDLIRVGVARDPYQALPLHGTFAGRRADALGMTVEVSVATVEAPTFAALPVGN
jgi:transglutaminase-like putative cysteine protease